MAVRKFKRKDKNGDDISYWGYDFRDKSGIRHRIESCKTKGQAEVAYRKVCEKLKNGELVKENETLTFEALTDAFIDSHCKVHCSLATQNKYISLNKIHLKPFLGDKRVIDIKVIDINNFIAHLQKVRKLAPKSINHAFGMVSTVFNYGINNDLINSNPCQKIKKLRLPYKEKNFLNPAQVNKLLGICKEHCPKFYPIIYTAIFTGMRKGELCALTWDKVDLIGKKILVDKSMYKNKIQEPKTLQSIRKIDIISSLVTVLKEHKASSHLGQYVFWGEFKTPLSGDATLWRHFDRIIVKAGLKDLTFHDLRHTYASLLISKNIPIKYIQQQMGHSTIKMTMDTYGHLMPDVYENAINALEDVLTEVKPEMKLRVVK